MGKAFVLHSGGIDSTTCLYIALNQFAGEDVVAVSVDYGQRHIKEIAQSRTITQNLGCEHMTIRLGAQPESMLTNPHQEIPNASYSELAGVSPTYVPFRNGQLLSYIAGIAHAKGGSGSEVFFGAHAEDAAGWAYPDCTPEFIGAMANAIYIGTYTQVRLVTPLQWLMKPDVIKLGNTLGVDYAPTWSCYAGGKLHCGTCPTCRSRRDGFIAAGVPDPTEYASDPATPKGVDDV